MARTLTPDRSASSSCVSSASRRQRRSRSPKGIVSVVTFVSIAAILGGRPVTLRAATQPSLAHLEVGAATVNSRPNIVVFMTDDETVADMQVMPETRQLISDEGVSFTNSFVSYPMCCPSRATYYTGQYARNHGVLYNHGPHGGYHAFKHAETSFPAALQRAAYHTIHIGKFLNRFG